VAPGPHGECRQIWLVGARSERHGSRMAVGRGGAARSGGQTWRAKRVWRGCALLDLGTGATKVIARKAALGGAGCALTRTRLTTATAVGGEPVNHSPEELICLCDPDTRTGTALDGTTSVLHMALSRSAAGAAQAGAGRRVALAVCDACLPLRAIEIVCALAATPLPLTTWALSLRHAQHSAISAPGIGTRAGAFCCRQRFPGDLRPWWPASPLAGLASL
jgi:hypothetical protein